MCVLSGKKGDEILLIDEGKLVGFGTHAELDNENNSYYQLLFKANIEFVNRAV